ncbi:MAG: hypothetical protein A2252_08335 [Elusimicrobia bacterium RIFOXYA2_FULL_39_19]|nr:MAG: hypothetical protein A2252_08335 [Elusimicrobia bacterium RIFOXYA2_FULL_39_19]
MNILLISDSYPPEVRSASQLMGEMALELKARGHNISVITTWPKYNISDKDKSLKYEINTIENGIQVIRIKTLPLHKANPIIRGVANLLLPLSFYNAAKKWIKTNIDIIIVYSPPLTLGITAAKLKKLYNAKFIMNVQDIFPQQAIDLKIMNNKSLIFLFEAIESYCYKMADIITVHSQGNFNYLNNIKKISSDKLKIVHNWMDLKPYESVISKNTFRRKYNLENKFIILYAGVIGLPQGLIQIVDAAIKLKNEKDIVFLLVGDGLDKNNIVNESTRLGLTNISFQNFVSLEDYPELVKECNIGLVCLSSKNKTPVVPGKLLGYMAAKIPAIAILNKESDGHQIISDAKCGYSVISGEDLTGFVNHVLNIKNNKDLCNTLGINGNSYLKKHFTKLICIDAYENYFN